MRIARNSEDRWLHPWYKFAYCYPRTMKDGAVLVYTSVDSDRKSTGIIWKPANKKHAMKVLEERLIQKRSPKPTSKKSQIDVNIALEHFFKYKIHNVSKQAKLQYIQAFKNFIPEDFSFDQIDTIEGFISDQLRISNVSDNTNWKRVQRIRKFFNYCVDKRWIQYNPISQELIPKYQDKEVEVPEEQDIAKILEYFESKQPEMHSFVLFLSLTGVRIQEAIDILRKDIYNDHFVIHGKGGDDRNFPLTIGRLNNISFNRKNYNLNQIISELASKKGDKLFKWLNQQTPAKNLRKALQMLELTKITAHSLRRYAINRWRLIKISLEMRSLLAGNSEVVQKKNYLKNPDTEYYEQNI